MIEKLEATPIKDFRVTENGVVWFDNWQCPPSKEMMDKINEIIDYLNNKEEPNETND